MNVINEVADFVSQADFSFLSSEARQCVKMHILDTIGAMLSGPQTRDLLELIS